MSSIKITRAVLQSSVALMALVPATRVIAGMLPQGVTLPAIALTEVSYSERKTVTLQPSVYCTALVQVTVIASTYAAQKDILEAVKKVCRALRGTFVGMASTVALDTTGPDFNDPTNGFYMQTQDLTVSFSQPT